MASTFEFDRVKAERSQQLMAIGRASLVMTGETYAQGLMGSLVSAEYLAASTGVVPFVEVNGVRGISVVGAARQKFDSPTPPPGMLPETWEAVRTLYLAAHGAVRQAHNAARPLAPGENALQDVPLPPIGAVPIIVVVALACVGIAAVIAGAKYLSDTQIARITVEGETARSVARTKAATDMAQASFDKTGQIPAAFWLSLKDQAEIEANKPIPSTMPTGILVGVGLTVGALGLGAWGLHRWFGGAR